MEIQNPVVLSIIIVNYNVKHFLSSCLNSVFASLKDIPAEVIVVDNDSSDSSVSMIKEQFPEVKLMENSENEGFSKANNRALKIAKGQFLLLLNPDTLVEENTFSECLDFFSKNPNTGGLGVRMIDGTGRFLPESKRGLPGIWASFCKISGIYNLFPKSSFFNHYYLGHIDQFTTSEIEILTGAFFMFPQKILEKVGMLDERFFMYGEDIDFSYRIHQSGHPIYYLPTTTIVHYKGESTKKSSLNYIKTFYGAMILFVDKHYEGNARKINLFLLKSAIYFRAFFAMLEIPLKKILPHLIFFVALYFSILAFKNIWAQWYFGDINYYPNTFEKINVPLYTFIFWMGYLFFGTFERQPDQLAPMKGWGVGLLIGGVVYAFLNLEYRNSRTILLISSILGFLIASIIFFIIRLKITGSIKSPFRTYNNFILVGSPEHERKVIEILDSIHPGYVYLGRVESDNNSAIPDQRDSQGKGENNQILGHLEDIKDIIERFNVEEIIFSSGYINSREIIKIMSKLGPELKYKILTPEGFNLLASQSKNSLADIITYEIQFKINTPSGRRQKLLFDYFSSIIILFGFPFIFIFQKRPLKFFSNLYFILIRKKTWVGYSQTDDLPVILPPIIFIESENSEAQSFMQFDYAKNYHWRKDFRILWSNIFHH